MRLFRHPALGLGALVTLVSVACLYATDPTYPGWWVTYEVAPAQPPAVADTANYTAWMHDNYAPATLGQLKYVATQTQAYLDDKLASVGGAGPGIGNLVANFSTDPAVNYAPVNLGQLKAVAQPFYDRVNQVLFDPKPGINFHLSGNANSTAWTLNQPWPAPPPASGQTGYNATTYANWVASAQNYAPANLGQLKVAFSFDLGNYTLPSNLSIAGDGIPDWWKVLNGLDPFAGNITSHTDFGNGRTDLQQYQYDLNVFNSTAGNLAGNLASFLTTYTTASTSFATVPANFTTTGNASIDFPRVAVPQYAAFDLGEVTVIDMDDDGDVLTSDSGNFALWSGGVAEELPTTDGDTSIVWLMAANNGSVLGTYYSDTEYGFARWTGNTIDYTSYYDIAAGNVSGSVTSLYGGLNYATRGGLIVTLVAGTDTTLTHDADGNPVTAPNSYWMLERFNLNGTVTKLGDTVFEGAASSPTGTISISYDLATDAAGDKLTRNWVGNYSNYTDSVGYLSSYSYNGTDMENDIPVYSSWPFTHTTFGGGLGNLTLTAGSAPMAHKEITNPAGDYADPEWEVTYNLYGGNGTYLFSKCVLTNLNGQPFLVNPFYGYDTTQAYYTIVSGNLQGGNLAGAANAAGPPASVSDDGLLADAAGQLVANGQHPTYDDLFPSAVNPDLTLNLTQLVPAANLTGNGNATIDLVSATNHAAVGTATNGTATHAVQYVPIGLAVDNNRDGNVSFDVDDKTSPQKPFRFWLNDDVDRTGSESAYSTVQDDLDPSNYTVDCETNNIQGTRDLEDFARLWISVAGIANAVSGNTFYIGLKWTVVSSGSPAIKLYAAYESDGGSQYLINGNTASSQVSYANNFTSIVGDEGNVTGAIVDPNYTSGNADIALVLPTDNDWDFVLPTALFANVTSSASVAHLLFEGCQRGKGYLSVVFLRRDGDGYHKLSYGPGIWLDLRDIKEMYERYTVGDGANDDSDGAMPPGNSQLSTARLPDGVATPFHYTVGTPGLSVPGDATGNKYITFVHGFNLTPWQRDAFAETMFKRLYWQGYKGKFGAFQWPTTWSTLPWGVDTLFIFDSSDYVAYHSASALEQRLKALRAQYGADNLFLYSHSHGGIVSSEALRLAKQRGDGQLVNTYVASEAAVPVQTYDPSQSTPSGFFGTDRYLTDSTTVSISANLAAGPTTPNIYAGWYGNNTGNSTNSTVNFFNANDYALSRGVWETDQALKPDQSSGPSDVHGAPDRHAPYGFSGNYSASPALDDFYYTDTIITLLGPTFAQVPIHLANSTALNDQYEIFSYAAEPRSSALGVSNISTNVTSSFNLGLVGNTSAVWPTDPLNGGDYHTHPWHSAPFRFDNMTNDKYWNALLFEFGLPRNH